jgi:hypothetical protein
MIELIIQKFFIRVSQQCVKLGCPLVKGRVHEPFFSDGFFDQFQHLGFPIRKGTNFSTGFLHVFKPGVAEGVPAVQLEIEDRVFMELMVSDYECEFTFFVHIFTFLILLLVGGHSQLHIT